MLIAPHFLHSFRKAKDVIVYDEEEEADEDVRSKNLVHFLGMKDGLTASIASQGSLSEESPRASIISRQTTLTTASSPPNAQRAPKIQRAQSMAATTASAAPPPPPLPVRVELSASGGAVLKKDTPKL